MRRACWGLFAAVVVACGSRESADRRNLLGSDAARRFVGTWDIVMTADSTSTALRFRRAPGPITGTMVFVLDRSGPASTAALQGVTHEGAYDLDVTPFGFSIHATDAPSVAVARLVPVVPRGRSAIAEDSLWIVLNPESERFPVRMQGLLAGDSVVGTWSADAFRVGGGTGHLVMNRQSARPDSPR
jgi:hypothetical protein